MADALLVSWLQWSHSTLSVDDGSLPDIEGKCWIFQLVGKNRHLPERAPAHAPDNDSFPFIEAGALSDKGNLIFAHLHTWHRKVKKQGVGQFVAW